MIKCLVWYTNVAVPFLYAAVCIMELIPDKHFCQCVNNSVLLYGESTYKLHNISKQSLAKSNHCNLSLI